VESEPRNDSRKRKFRTTIHNFRCYFTRRPVTGLVTGSSLSSCAFHVLLAYPSESATKSCRSWSSLWLGNDDGQVGIRINSLRAPTVAVVSSWQGPIQLVTPMNRPPHTAKILSKLRCPMKARICRSTLSWWYLLDVLDPVRRSHIFSRLLPKLPPKCSPSCDSLINRTSTSYLLAVYRVSA